MLFLLFWALPVGAQNNQVINDDFYIAGGNVNAGSEVNGDLAAAGGNVFIGGNIQNDLAAAGGSITVMGNVGDDARLIGGNMMVGKNVGDDLVALGGSLEVLPGVNIGGDVLATVGELKLDGNVSGSVKGSAGIVYLNGKILRDVEITASEKLVIGPNAYIFGNLIYKSPRQAEIPVAENIRGKISYEPLSVSYGQDKSAMPVGGMIKYFLGFIALMSIIKLAIKLVAGIALVYLLKRCSSEIVMGGLDKFWVMVLKGFLALVATPILAIVLLFTVVGSMLGGLLGVAYVFVLMMAMVYSGIIAGGLFYKYFYKVDKPVVDWKLASIGILLAHLVCLLPFIGWIISLVLVCAGVGSIISHFYMGIASKKC